MAHTTSNLFLDDVQGHVEYAEVDDPQYFSFERKGWYSYIKDQVGTITKVYKHQTKQMINTKTFDVFGNLVNQTGSSDGNLGFQSKYYDQESGLNYYYHRYYYPTIGRFINEDPIGLSGGLNMYGFVGNNPINMIDPLGLHYAEDYRELLDKWDEAFNKYKEIIRRAKVERIEYDKYCPTWDQCYKNCVYAGLFTGVESMTLLLWNMNIDIIRYTTTVIKITSAASALSGCLAFGGALGAVGVSAYCAIHCLFNKRAY